MEQIVLAYGFSKAFDFIHRGKMEQIVLAYCFSLAFDSIRREKLEQIVLAYGLPKETVVIIIMFYKDMKAMVYSSDFFDFVAGFLRGDTLAPFLIHNLP